MLPNNWLALLVSLSCALVWLRMNDYAAHRGWISSQLSRKIVHIGTGPLFVLTWLLFQANLSAPWMAMLIPAAITGQFFLVGTGVLRDPAAVVAMSRTGDRREILRGPLYYGIVFVLLTLIYWNRSPIGITALMMLCGGDGLADVIGKRVSSPRLPWSKGKTVAGSASVFIGGFLLSTAMLAVYSVAGILPQPVGQYTAPVALIALAATLVESLPLRDLDNLTVPAVSVLFGHLLF